MSTLLSSNEPLIRFSFFVGIFVFMAIAEFLWPRRKRMLARSKRWVTNLSISAINLICIRLISLLIGLAIPVVMARFAYDHHWGILNQFDAIPSWLKLCLSLIMLDLIIYWQHRLFHAVPALWRLHRVHHLDLDLDVSTGNRFHPIEIILSLFIKTTAVFVFGISATAVVMFEIILNGMSQFNHSNVRLGKADYYLRKLVVTPDFHITHHSTIPKETNSNFGFNLSLWDKLFSTYRSMPQKGYVEVEIGLEDIRNPEKTLLKNSLMNPFKSNP